MSAYSRTTWTVTCDHGGCSEHLHSNEVPERPGGGGALPAGLRQILRQEGWATGVLVAGATCDFCPEHKGDAER